MKLSSFICWIKEPLTTGWPKRCSNFSARCPTTGRISPSITWCQSCSKKSDQVIETVYCELFRIHNTYFEFGEQEERITSWRSELSVAYLKSPVSFPPSSTLSWTCWRRTPVAALSRVFWTPSARSAENLDTRSKTTGAGCSLGCICGR